MEYILILIAIWAVAYVCLHLIAIVLPFPRLQPWERKVPIACTAFSYRRYDWESPPAPKLTVPNSMRRPS